MSQEKETTPIDSGTEGFYADIFRQVEQLHFYVNVCLLSFFLQSLSGSIKFQDLIFPEGGRFSFPAPPSGKWAKVLFRGKVVTVLAVSDEPPAITTDPEDTAFPRTAVTFQ